MNHPRRLRRGLTLIELMVGMAIGLFVVAAAFTFTVHQNRLLEFTSRELDRDRTGRVAIDLITQDLRHAGLGVGYSADGTFNGLRLGSFSVPGGAVFESNNAPITLTRRVGEVDQTYASVTDDIGIRFANGSFRSIVQFGPGVGQICRGGEFEKDDVVLLQSEDGVDARTVKLLSVASAGVCNVGSCIDGCDTFTFIDDGSFLATANSAGTDYEGGEMAGQYKEAVWFVDDGDLIRAEITASNPCTARDSSCGGVLASGVETIQMRIWQWDPNLGSWEDRTALASLVDRRRIRIDVELVVRTDGGKAHSQPAVELQLEPGRCLPDCGTNDEVARRAYRVSVEVRNSGRMQLGGAW